MYEEFLSTDKRSKFGSFNTKLRPHEFGIKTKLQAHDIIANATRDFSAVPSPLPQLDRKRSIDSLNGPSP